MPMAKSSIRSVAPREELPLGAHCQRMVRASRDIDNVAALERLDDARRGHFTRATGAQS